jgi:hypothetical protein
MMNPVFERPQFGQMHSLSRSRFSAGRPAAICGTIAGNGMMVQFIVLSLAEIVSLNRDSKLRHETWHYKKKRRIIIAIFGNKRTIDFRAKHSHNSAA